MTEPVTTATRELEPTVVETFTRRWGDMAAAWGINRTMAEIQGLLYITGAALSAEEIMARLQISRGNASMSLRALVEWGVVHKFHRRGDRRDYFQSLSDVWEIFTRVVQQRKRREVDPILATLQDCERQLSSSPQPLHEEDERCRERLENMLSFLATLAELAERFTGAEHGLARAMDLLTDGRP